MKLRGTVLNRRAEGGSAMIYAMLFAAVTAIVVFQMSRLSDIGWFNTKSEELKSARDTLYKRVQTTAGVEDAIYKSLLSGDPNNGPLAACLKFNNCAGSQNSRTSFDLYNAQGTLVAGTANNPAQYDKLGNPCTSNCVFSAYASFWATCTPGNPSGSCPDTIYTVTQIRTTGTPPMNLPAPAPAPTDPQLQANVIQFANALATAKVMQNKSMCPTGEVAVQVINGILQCTSIAANPNTCPGTQVMIGIRPDGSSVCIPDASMTCWSGVANTTFKCNNGGCTQGAPLSINCGYNGPNAMRLTGMSPVKTGNLCTQARQGKKRGGGYSVGNLNCSQGYNFTCCG